jgi:cyclase
MLRRRVIPCLDVANGRVVKGTRFVDLTDEGDAPELAERYAREGADELVFLDITAAPEGRGTLLDIVERTARRAFVPLTVGGGVRSVDDMRDVLRAGADKVSLNTRAVAEPDLVTRCAARFGSQAVVVAIDARRRVAGAGDPRFPSGFEVVVKGGREPVGLDAIEWARQAVTLGASCW